MKRNRIKELRLQKGLKQIELARKLGMDRSYVNRLEKGNTGLGLSVSLRIANVLDCSIEQLFFEDDVALLANKEVEQR